MNVKLYLLIKLLPALLADDWAADSDLMKIQKATQRIKHAPLSSL